MKPELLSPAGSMEALYAAALNGADAVYLGAKSLNARQGAGNFDRDELIFASDFLHERGKKLYVTVNTIVKQSELSELEDIAAQLHACRADAAIVQDAGVCRVLKQMLPELKLHASTQMAICNVQGAMYLKQNGFERAVLAREMDLSEIRACADTGIQTEVFCHGALCVACSGQCLFSSLVGGRSGNRGACAQPCRLPYQLKGAINAEGFLLSPKDLCTAGLLGEFEKANVTSLKIEGRLKRPEYVAVVTGIYRRLLDGENYSEEHERALKQIFNRGGFTRGYALGIRDGDFLSVKRPSHWGVRVASAPDTRRVNIEADIKSEDALVLRDISGEEIPIKISGAKGTSAFNPAKRAGEVFRLVSKDQMDAARRSFEKETPSIALNAECSIRKGAPMTLKLTDGIRRIEVTGETVRSVRSGAFDPERVSAQLKKTGGTPYSINVLALGAGEDAFVAVSEVNALRREALKRLSEARTEAFSPAFSPLKRAEYPVIPPYEAMNTSITVQSDDVSLLRRLLDGGADEAVLEIRDIRRDKLDVIDADGLFLYLPPVLHTDTLKRLNTFALERAKDIKGVYMTNPAHIAMEWPGERRYDFTLNLANTPAISFSGAENAVYTPSLELTAGEIKALGGKTELIVYGRAPLMRLRHCPLNAARGGGPHVSCRACDAAKAGKTADDTYFVDRMRAEFPLKRLASDEGCIISLYNSVPLNLIAHMDRLPPARSVRLVFTDETPERALEILSDFIKAVRGNEKPAATGRFTTGHYFKKT